MQLSLRWKLEQLHWCPTSQFTALSLVWMTTGSLWCKVKVWYARTFVWVAVLANCPDNLTQHHRCYLRRLTRLDIKATELWQTRSSAHNHSQHRWHWYWPISRTLNCREPSVRNSSPGRCIAARHAWHLDRDPRRKTSVGEAYSPRGPFYMCNVFLWLKWSTCLHAQEIRVIPWYTMAIRLWRKFTLPYRSVIIPHP